MSSNSCNGTLRYAGLPSGAASGVPYSDACLGVTLCPSRKAHMYSLGLWKDQILTDFFEQSVSMTPEAIAVVSFSSALGKATSKSYAELAEDVDRVVRGLRGLGVHQHEVISVQLPNCWQFVAIVLACTKLGCVVNPIMPSARARDLLLTLRECRSRVLFTPRHFRGTDYGALVAEFRESLSELKAVVMADDAVLHGFDGLPEPRDASCMLLARMDADAVTEIMFTSGTTGRPKGVMHTSNTLISATRAFASQLELGEKDVIFMGSPLAHQTGYLWGIYLPLLLGVKAVLLDIWSPETAALLIAAERATFSISAPTFLSDLISVHESSENSLNSLKTFVLAGAPVPSALVERAGASTSIRIASAWGMTEVALPTISHREDDSSRVSSTDGSIVKGMEMRIVDAAGMPVSDGIDGRLQVRGAFNFVGYLGRPDLFDTDDAGWFNTGDLGHIVDNAHLRITGRVKDIVIRGGEKIPVADIENLLYRHPQVADVAIVAMPDERLGERACVFITTHDCSDLSLAELTDFLLASGVTKVYLPERLQIISEMPRTASGKIQKFVLRELAKEFVDA